MKYEGVSKPVDASNATIVLRYFSDYDYTRRMLHLHRSNTGGRRQGDRLFTKVTIRGYT